MSALNALGSIASRGDAATMFVVTFILAIGALPQKSAALSSRTSGLKLSIFLVSMLPRPFGILRQ